MTSNIKHAMDSIIPVVFNITTKAYTGVFMTLMMTTIGGKPLASKQHREIHTIATVF
jgi:hypothetical protein